MNLEVKTTRSRRVNSILKIYSGNTNKVNFLTTAQKNVTT